MRVALFDHGNKREVGDENNVTGMMNKAIMFRLQENGALMKYSHYLV